MKSGERGLVKKWKDKKKKSCYLYAKRSSLQATENDQKLKQQPSALGGLWGTDHSHLPCHDSAETVLACDEACAGVQQACPGVTALSEALWNSRSADIALICLARVHPTHKVTVAKTLNVALGWQVRWEGAVPVRVRRSWPAKPELPEQILTRNLYKD